MKGVKPYLHDNNNVRGSEYSAFFGCNIVSVVTYVPHIRKVTQCPHNVSDRCVYLKLGTERAVGKSFN
ncbi:hypothetical protein CHS0354_030346 [Potamilus streckersoni]|uniref:Uncharacterized protein n=1 Tax=Potamilus streckersoni TaxID=2493646 RepID=A0AAE0T474_9BIVA|nr:hypothetical protein CHS0354_030346 [Potamilus streckersoni]